VVGIKESVQPANPIGKRGDNRSAMRNALVTWHRDFGVDVRRSFYPKFHVCLFNLGNAPSDALSQKHPLKDTVVQRVAGPQLWSRNKKNLVRVGIFHFGARGKTA